MYVDLIQNTSLIVALTTLYSLLSRLKGYGETWGKILLGLLFGGVAMVGMQLPFHYAPGVFYDGRSIILAMAGLFGGGTTAVVSTVLAGVYRAQIGGAGVWAGLGTILGCAGVGLILRRGCGKASKQMGELIDDLLKFSRLGRKSIIIGDVSLDDALKAAVETFSDQIERTGAQVNFPEQMPVIQGDLTLVIHVLINLLENALKYHKPAEPPVIDIGIEIEDQYAVVSISDNGIGIEPEYHEKIFKMFQRLHSQAEYPGTGIGLAAVKKAVQMMGGDVRVESESGKGSVFKIKLLSAMTA